MAWIVIESKWILSKYISQAKYLLFLHNVILARQYLFNFIKKPRFFCLLHVGSKFIFNYQDLNPTGSQAPLLPLASANPERPGCCVGISEKQSCETTLQFLQKCHRYEYLTIIRGLSHYYDKSVENISVDQPP